MNDKNWDRFYLIWTIVIRVAILAGVYWAMHHAFSKPTDLTNKELLAYIIVLFSAYGYLASDEKKN